MNFNLILASRSQIRAQMLTAAGIRLKIESSDLDESAIKTDLAAQGQSFDTIAIELAGAKAQAVSLTHPQALVLGSDQLLSVNGTLLSKPKSELQARAQLDLLRGKTHHLFTGAVLCQNGQRVWHICDRARLTMRHFSDSYRDAYIARNWPEIGHSVGAYMIEKEGIRLFSDIQGDHFTILGLPLLPVLDHLITRESIPA